ncbi:hypothetical protein CR513_32487, partial [Mucuna pruriens]
MRRSLCKTMTFKISSNYLMVLLKRKALTTKKPFSPVSSKDSFRTIMTLSMVCKQKKFIYDLKQASRQWYYKFHQVITSYGFRANVVDDCVYHKFSGSKYIFLVLYVDDILLVSSDTSLFHETKRFLTKNFEMKDLGGSSFVLGIQIL